MKKNSTTSKIDPGQRAHMVAEAAYYKAQSRDFAEGDTVQDWYEAEHDIDLMLEKQEKKKIH